jgi:putative nucleotidyltransferase with HDIG domain/PAS domain S-box-containing protein
MQLSQPGLSQFLEALPDPALVLDRTATIRLANRPVHDLFGYRPGELAAQAVYLIVPRYPGQSSNDAGQSYSARHKNGQEFIVEIRTRPITLVSEPLTLCTVRDASPPARVEPAVYGSMDRHRRTLDQMLEGCQIIGFDWRYLYVNDAVCRQGRKPREALLGMTMMEAYPGIDATPMFAALRRCMEGRTPVTFENEFRYPDGEAGWFELSIQPVPEGVLILSIDTTARKRAERDNERQLRQLQALRAIDLAIMGSTDVSVALETVLHQARALLAVDAAAILTLDPATRILEYQAGAGFRSRAIEQTRVPLGRGIAGRAAQERQPLAVSDLQGTGPEFQRRALLGEEGFVAYQAIPLVAKDEVQGILELFHRTPLEVSTTWQDCRDALAGQAAIALDSGRLHHALERTNGELLQAYDSTIEGWSRALDLRDQETLGHSLRVTDLTVQMARLAGMTDEELVQVRRGALLHDIGKMGVPDAILRKPGPLSEEEWAVMRQHPVFAYELLRPIDYLRPALDIPYCHHEKWDGTGYPRGLGGEAIPLAARLFAVVDVWDAIRSDRPYRTGWPEDRVIDHLLSQAGVHFDPRAVDLFFQVMGETGK